MGAIIRAVIGHALRPGINYSKLPKRLGRGIIDSSKTAQVFKTNAEAL